MDACSKTKSLYKIGKYDDNIIVTFTGMSGSSITDPPGKNKNLQKQHFVVKVQVPSAPFEGMINKKVPNDFLVIYNEDKSFNIVMFKDGNTELYHQLSEKVRSEGHHGIKGYFHTILEHGDKKANQFRINPENIFVEPW